jgi:DNA polymerase elongation subunit (family B)
MRFYDLSYITNGKPFIIKVSSDRENPVEIFTEPFYPYFFVEYSQENKDKIKECFSEILDELSEYSRANFKLVDENGNEIDFDNIPIVEKNKTIEVKKNNTKRKFFKIILNTPHYLSKLRDCLEKKGVRTYESNIPLTSRFLVDNDFEIEKEKNNFVFLDIEVITNNLRDYGNGNIITVSLYDGESYHLISQRGVRKSFIENYDFGDYKIENVKVYYVNNEYELLITLLSILYHSRISHFIAWNVLFDWNWITKSIDYRDGSKIRQFGEVNMWLSPALMSPNLIIGLLANKFYLENFLNLKNTLKLSDFRGILPLNYNVLYKRYKELIKKHNKLEALFNILLRVFSQQYIFDLNNHDFKERFKILQKIIENRKYCFGSEDEKILREVDIEDFNDFVYMINYVYSFFINSVERHFLKERDDVPWKGQKSFNIKEKYYDIFGVVIVDLLEVFRKINMKEEVSYALDYIAKKVLGFGKSLEFDPSLWKTNPEEIERYNVNDVFLIVKINEKLNALDLFEELKVTTRIENLNKVFSQTAMINNYFLHNSKQLNVIFPYKNEFEKDLYISNISIKKGKKDKKDIIDIVIEPDKERIKELLKEREELLKKSIEKTYDKGMEDFLKKSAYVEFKKGDKVIKSILPWKPSERNIEITKGATLIQNGKDITEDILFLREEIEKDKSFLKKIKDKYEIEDKVLNNINELKDAKVYITGGLEKDNPVPGGYVRNVKKGLYETVAVFDFASLYPNIIINWNISPDSLMDYSNVEIFRELEEIDEIGEIMDKLVKENIITEDYVEWFFNTIKFKGNIKMSNNEGLIPHFIRKLIKKRYEYKKLEKDMLKKYEETKDEKYLVLSQQYHAKNWSYKILINAIYGWQGYKNSMVYHPILSSLITTIGRMTDLWLIYKLKKLGYNPIYADTDSIFVPLKHKFNGSNFDELQSEIDYLNELFRNLLDEWVYSFVPRKRKILIDGEKYSLEDFEHTMEFEFEYLIYKIVFHQKKMYYYREIDLSEKIVPQKIKVKGLDIKKSDKSFLQKYTQEKIIKHFLDIENLGGDAGLREFISRVKNIVKAGDNIYYLKKFFNVDTNDGLYEWMKIIGTPTKISKSAEEYKGSNSVPMKVIRFSRAIFGESPTPGSKYFVLPLKTKLSELLNKEKIIKPYVKRVKSDLDIITFSNYTQFLKIKNMIPNIKRHIDIQSIEDNLIKSIIRVLPDESLITNKNVSIKDFFKNKKFKKV